MVIAGAALALALVFDMTAEPVGIESRCSAAMQQPE